MNAAVAPDPIQVPTEDVDGIPLDDPDVDGIPIKDEEKEDIDGVPMTNTPLIKSAAISALLGYNDDDDEEDIDGAPCTYLSFLSAFLLNTHFNIFGALFHSHFCALQWMMM